MLKYKKNNPNITNVFIEETAGDVLEITNI